MQFFFFLSNNYFSFHFIFLETNELQTFKSAKRPWKSGSFVHDFDSVIKRCVSRGGCYWYPGAALYKRCSRLGLQSFANLAKRLSELKRVSKVIDQRRRRWGIQTCGIHIQRTMDLVLVLGMPPPTILIHVQRFSLNCSYNFDLIGPNFGANLLSVVVSGIRLGFSLTNSIALFLWT